MHTVAFNDEITLGAIKAWLKQGQWRLKVERKTVRKQFSGRNNMPCARTEILKETDFIISDSSLNCS